MSVRIITHCYAERLPQYATFLRAHLTSLLDHPPQCEWGISVCCTEGDARTMDVIAAFLPLLEDRLKPVLQEPTHLYRRTIGRNKEGLRAKEDVVWYADGDLMFGEGCLDALDQWFAADGGKHTLVWPTKTWCQVEHEQGDAFCEANSLNGFGPVDVPWGTFGPRRVGFAYGPFQISPGAFARQHGYLNDPKFSAWMQPRTDGKPFGDTLEDRKYRHFCKEMGPTSGVDIPGVYRFRHSQDARDSRKGK